jgi:Spy/CpxP family protein refolding chaperone
MSRSFRMLRVLSIAGALAGLAGCVQDAGSSKAPDPTEGTSQAPLAEADGPAGERFHGPQGPEHLLRAALHELTLTDAQKTTIEGALAKLGPKDHPPMDRGPIAALAAGVRAGKIDPAALAAPAAPPDFEQHRAAVAEALNTLHATLTKDQRRALVDALEKKLAEHDPGDMPEHHGDREHGDHGRGGPLGHLLRGLDLSDAQRDAIHKALEAQAPAPPDREEMKKRFEAMHTEMRAKLEAFAADTFDAKTLAAPPAGMEHGPGEHMAHMVKELSIVVPLLEPAQREKLATMLEKGPPAR